MSAGISFDEWGAVDQHHARLMARDPDVKPLYLRVMFAGIGWANLIGHAEFAPGGLALILQSSDPKTGEVSIPSRRQVNAAIERARESGLVSQGSSRFCLLAPTWWEKSGGHGGKTCNHHGIRSRSRRDKRSPGTAANRDKRSPAPGQEKSRSEPLTCSDADPSMTLISQPEPPAQPQVERKSA